MGEITDETALNGGGIMRNKKTALAGAAAAWVAENWNSQMISRCRVSGKEARNGT